MRVRNHVVWFVMRTYQLQSNARWAPPEHHRATELRHIPVLHRGKETMQDEYRNKHIFLTAMPRSNSGITTVHWLT